MKPSDRKLQALRRANLELKDSLKECRICPRNCGVDRMRGKIGYCRAGHDCVVYSFLAHHGEEPPISGARGSGTIFFAHCNMKCLYCQNYRFSQHDEGKTYSDEKLAEVMLYLQGLGCHNINLVSPTHFVPQILRALEIALGKGLEIPIAYNTSGYESLSMLKILDGIVDIYMPDMRYSDNAIAKTYSDAPDYVEINRAAVMEMYRQVGVLQIAEDGTAKKGLIIRLLAMPGNVSGTVNTLRFIRNDIGKNTYLSIMSQYYPTFKALDNKLISRTLTAEEYKIVVDEAKLLELNNGWIQEDPSNAGSKFLGINIKPKD